MRALTLLALLTAVAAAAPVPFPKPNKPGHELFGTWEVVRLERFGEGSFKEPARTFLKFEAGKWSFLRDDGKGGTAPSASYVADLDRTKSPMWLDLRPLAPGMGKEIRGVLRIDGEQLFWACAPGRPDRPADAKASRDGEMVYVFKRVTKGGAR